jgi:hydroxypyruvate isomerase
MQLMEGNIINTLSDYFEQIGYIHAADVPGRNEPGTGELNYGNIIKMLDALGYKGVMGFELFPKRASQEAINAIQKIMQGSGR